MAITILPDGFELSTGRKVYAHCGIVGMSAEIAERKHGEFHPLTVPEGYDGSIMIGADDTRPAWTEAEQHELADWMIWAWVQWKTGISPKGSDSNKPLGIVELLTSIGDNNIKFQNLLESATNYDLRKKGAVTAITFLTDAVTPTEIMNDTQTKVGLVVWLPRAQTEALLASRRKPTRPE
jgi:hypothetical protein